MASIEIRPIDSPDILPACASILVEAYNLEPWNDEWTQETAFRKLETFYLSPKFYGWTAWDGAKLLGCCFGNIEPYFTGDYYYLKEMFVSPSAQAKGIGNQLMDTATAFLPSIEVEMIILFTSKEHYPFDFYERKGFMEMDGMRMMVRGEE